MKRLLLIPLGIALIFAFNPIPPTAVQAQEFVPKLNKDSRAGDNKSKGERKEFPIPGIKGDHEFIDTISLNPSNWFTINMPVMGESLPMNPFLSGGLNDSLTRQRYLEALRSYYSYSAFSYRHHERVFKWNHISSVLIFVAVLLLVFTGIYFAAVQFHRGGAQSVKSGSPENMTQTEFSANLKGVKISSPILGVVILVISLAFFYLYLIYVYPIIEI